MIGTSCISAPRCTPKACIFSDWLHSFKEELVLFTKFRRGTFLILLPVSFSSNCRIFPQYTKHRVVMTKAIHTNMYFHQISVKSWMHSSSMRKLPAIIIRDVTESNNSKSDLPGYRPPGQGPPGQKLPRSERWDQRQRPPRRNYGTRQPDRNWIRTVTPYGLSDTCINITLSRLLRYANGKS